MDIATLSDLLDLKQVGGDKLENRIIDGCIVGDLLSVVMGKAKNNNLWVTIQSHVNIIAVASLINISGVIITEGFKADVETIEKANEENIKVFESNLSTYEIVKQLVKLDI